MKNVIAKVCLNAAAAFVLAAVPGSAQQFGHVSVKVPFEFTAGSATLPAGEYSFEEGQNGIVLIRCMEQHKAVLVLTNALSPGAIDGSSSVMFDKVDGQYSLSQINVLGEPSRRLLRFDQAEGSSRLGAKLGVTNAASKGLKK